MNVNVLLLGYLGAVFSLEIANQVVLKCKLPKVVLVNVLYGLGQVLISRIVL